MRHGFSLVELSIVLVILGLLTGGILAGQSLIRASQLRAVTTEYQRYVTATNTFRDKYFALPGDMTNATRFWGDDNAQCPDAAIANGTPGTCNGNGNGLYSLAGGANTTSEAFRYWQHLALAGLIEGTYSGNAGSVDQYSAIIGTNIPASRLSSGSWYLYGENYTFAGHTEVFNGNWASWLQFGAAGATDNYGKVLKPEEAWNIDTKIDDGKPGYGKMIVRYWDDCTDAATSAALTANYLLTETSLACVLMFVHYDR